MRRFVNPGKRIASFTRTFARLRWALGFDGVGVRSQLANRAINVDGDIDIEFYTSDVFGATKVIVSQNITSTNTAKEFQLETSATGSLIIRLGGAAQNMGTVLPATKYRVSLVGTSLVLYSKEGAVVSSLTFNRGATREPTAVTVVGAATNGVANIYAFYFTGIQRDIKINGVRWPMADRNQAIQLPKPSGLGAELITQSVLENPAAKGTQWTYLGNGRWQYVGDGSFNELRFISAQPVQGFVEFEVEQISGQMRCVGTGGIPESFFSDVGVKRFFYKDLSAIAYVGFVRNTGVASCIIKNISFKPLDSCNPMTISNATSANWVQVVDDYVAKFRKVLRFDGIGVRGVAGLKAIDIATDFDLAWSLKGVTKGRWQTIVSQNIMVANNDREFSIELSNVNSIAILLGGIIYTRSAIDYTEDGNYRLTRVGSTAYLYKNGALVEQFTANSGAAREASASFSVGFRLNGSIGAFSNYLQGVIYNVKINGILWPIADSAQSIQLPEPSGLGAELITQSVLENPQIVNNQWTYLGDGRWQYIGNGSANVLAFIGAGSQPSAGFLEFEVESISGGTMRCSLSATVNNASDPLFSTTGIKRYFFTSRDSTNAFQFARNTSIAITCIIKNISFKPLGTCNPIALANVTSANWEDLEI